MKKVIFILVTLALCAVARVEAVSGISGGSRAPSPPPTSKPSVADAPAPKAPTVIVQKSASPAAPAVSKSGISGGNHSGTESSTVQQKVVPQGATAQIFAVEAKKAAALAAFTKMEHEKAVKFAEKPDVANLKTVTITRSATNTTARTTTTPMGEVDRPSVDVVQQPGYHSRDDSDYWRGVAAGSMNNNRTIIVHQPSSGITQQSSGVPVTGVTSSDTGGYAPPSSDGPHSETYVMRFFVWVLAFIALAGGIYYAFSVYQKRELARANFRPNHIL